MSASYVLVGWLLIISFIVSACAGVGTPVAPVPTTRAVTTATPAPAASTVPPQSEINPLAKATFLPEEAIPPSLKLEFSTDFSKHSVPYREILSGGPSKDGIPAIDHPRFVSVSEADEWLEPVEPVIFLQIGDDARAYPIQIIMWHEIVNDVVDGVPVVVTFCPLCNTAIAFERTAAGGQVFDFGTTGRLRYSNLIMYDRQTETWWQQATGEAIVGELTGTQLTFHPASIVAWETFKQTYPGGKVLSRQTGFNRPYGRNPYAGYDDVNNTPFLYRGPETPGTLLPMARVLTVQWNGETVAYPYDVLKQWRVVNDTIGGVEVAVMWTPGAASALDADQVAGGREVGSASVYRRALDGETLSFLYNDARILDHETGSEWDVFGRAVRGPLAGKQLTPVVAVNHFWFSWAAFRPETRVFSSRP